MKTGRKYGEKEKIQILIKSLIFRTLRIYIFSFYAFLFFVSLPDAKIPKYIPEGFVGGDFADDFAEVVEGFAEVLGYQVRREGGYMEAGADTLESGCGADQGFVVANVGHEGLVAAASDFGTYFA